MYSSLLVKIVLSFKSKKIYFTFNNYFNDNCEILFLFSSLLFTLCQYYLARTLGLQKLQHTNLSDFMRRCVALCAMTVHKQTNAPRIRSLNFEAPRAVARSRRGASNLSRETRDRRSAILIEAEGRESAPSRSPISPAARGEEGGGRRRLRDYPTPRRFRARTAAQQAATGNGLRDNAYTRTHGAIRAYVKSRVKKKKKKRERGKNGKISSPFNRRDRD